MGQGIKSFSGQQEKAKRRKQIEKGLIQTSKPFVPSTYHFTIAAQ